MESSLTQNENYIDSSNSNSNSVISIIIPVYNASKYIEKCLESIINQTYQSIEIIVINDGSKDNSLEILNEYASKDNRIKVIDKENGGVSSARNLGIDKATGKYIMFIDSDDYIEKDMLEVMCRQIERQEAQICLCGMNVVSIKDEKSLEDKNTLTSTDRKNCKKLSYEIRQTYTYNEQEDVVLDSKEEYLRSLQLNWAPFCKLIDKELVKNIRYDKSVAIAEDLLFNAMIIMENEPFKVAICNDPFYNYVDVPTSAMKSSYNSKMLQGLETEEKVYHMLKEIDSDNRLSKVLFSGVITFFFKYATADKKVRKEKIEDYKKAVAIVKKHKKYLLEKRERGTADRLKMKCICYCPGLYLVLRNLGKK